MSPAQQLMRMTFGFIVSQALRVAADLKIADLIGDAERSVDSLAAETNSQADALYRVMRLLAAEGVFYEEPERVFALTALGKALKSDDRASPANMIRMMAREPYAAFARLDHAVATGLPSFTEVFGKSRFDWLAEHPSDAALFQAAMMSLSQGDNAAVAEAYDFTSYRRVVDVGGGHGQLLSEILSRNAQLSGVLFDRPAGLTLAKAGKGGPLPRTEFVAGDFFEGVPVGADMYILKKVIHDWTDEQAIKILRNCRDAVADDGKVLIAEAIVSTGNDYNPIKTLDAVMLVVTGGCERTEEAFAKLFAAAGLRLDRVVATSRPISILEGSKV